MKNEILEIAKAFVKKNKTYPSMTDLLRLGVKRTTMRDHFGNLTGLHDAVYKECKEFFFDLNKETLRVDIKKYKRFVITTAVSGAEVDEAFLKNIRAYCKDQDAKLLILLSLAKIGDAFVVSPSLRDETFILSDTKLNSNAFILGIKNTAGTVDPITGLPRIGQRNGTFICASPKQRLKYVPTGVNKLPHALMSTGAITRPNYIKSKNMIDKKSYMADNDHIMGAIIFELDKGDIFYFRQIQADKAGAFVDLGDHYSLGKKRKMAPEAFAVGDWHSGDTDPAVVSCLKELNKALKPKRWIMHDIFDGLSVNPHTVGKSIVRAKLSAAGKLSLVNELEQLKLDIKMIASIVKEVVIVRSNHDDFLDRYLNNANYVGDDKNHRVALELAISSIDGLNPLEEYVGKMANVTWLKLDESFILGGVECGMHGHLGGNGARGTIGQMETAYGDVIFGHSHTPGILRNAWNIGTSTFLELGYNHGASSWVQCSGIVYPNGQKQLINFIEGKFTTRKF